MIGLSRWAEARVRLTLRLRVLLAPWQRCPAPFAPSGPRAELASWGDAGECISGSCMARIAATRARSTFPQRRPAGCCLRSGAGWPGWRGSECSRWKLLPSEVIDHDVGGSEARRPRAPGQNSNIKGASFFCASGAGWRCQLPPTKGGLVGLRSSEASQGGLCHRQQRRAARDCMLWPRTSGGAPCPPPS